MRPILFILLFFFTWNVCAAGEDLADRIDFDRIVFDDGAGGELRSPLAVCCDPRAGEIFVVDTGNRRILIYDCDLLPKYSFEHFVPDRRTGRATPGEPRNLAVNHSGDILVIDNLADFLDVLDFRGTSLTRVYPNRVLGDTTLNIRPDLITLDENGNIYLSVVGDLHTVLVLDADYNLKRQIGIKGDSVENINTIVGMTVSQGKLYLTDLYGIPAFKIFDTSGVYLSGFGKHDIEKNDISMVAGLVVTPITADSALIWAADALRQVIKVIDDKGNFIANIGGFGIRVGEYRYPSGLAICGSNTFFVVERGGNRVQRFTLR